MKTLLRKKERRNPEEDPLPSSSSNNNNNNASDDVEPSTTYRSFSSIPRMRPTSSSNNNNNNTAVDPLEEPHGNNSNNNNGTTTTQALLTTNYRGFDTSIADLFRYRQHERTDCCALTCCGVLQSDRDRFLLTGITPPSWIKRCTVHVLTPVMIFFIAGIGALHIQDATVNQLFCTALILVLIGYGITACAKGRAKRIRIRKDLLFTKYQVLQQQQQQQQQEHDHDHHHHQSLSFVLEQERPDYDDDGDMHNDDDAYYYLGQGRWDFACAHPPCCGLGCYVEDRKQPNKQHDVADSDADADETTTTTTTTKDDLSTCLWTCLAHPCCGMHLQCCGVCAVAQEARELERTILPPRYRRIDYITMQPVMEYYPAIYQAKWRNRSRRNVVVGPVAAARAAGASASSNALSLTQPMQQQQQQQQQQITQDAEASAAEAGESIRDMMHSPDSYSERTGISFPPPLSRLSKRLLSWFFLILTLVMIYGILAPLYFRYVLQDKLRARIAFSLADFGVFGLVFGQAFVLLAILVWITNRPKYAELSFDAMVKFFAAGFCLSTTLAVFWELVVGLVVRVLVSLLLAIGGVNAVDDPETKESFLSFVPWSGGGMAMDWIPFDMPLAKSSRDSSRDFLDSFGRAHPVLYTIYIMVVTFLLAAFVEELCKYFGYRMCDEHPDFLSQQELKDASHVVFADGDHDDDTEEDGEHHHHRHHRQHHRRQHEVENNNDVLDFAQQRQSYQAQGAAVTLAMLCVAMGFTCCENLVYVFIYSSASVNMELSVLFARSIFPVHPICAAIQSIGVCQRDIEGDRSAKLGRSIIFPAVLFHGSYDFFIVWIDFLANRKLGVAANDDDATGVDASKSYGAALTSFAISVCLIVGALFYYGKEARKQRRRLIAMDEQVTLEQSRLL